MHIVLLGGEDLLLSPLKKSPMISIPYALRDERQRIEHLLHGRLGTVGVTAKDNRLFVEAVLYRYHAGILLARSAKRLVGFWVIHTRHMRCSRRGV